MLAAKVIPVGVPPSVERYQPSTMTRPMATPVTGQRHFPCSPSSGRFRTSQTPSPATRTPMTSHGRTPRIPWRVAG